MVVSKSLSIGKLKKKKLEGTVQGALLDGLERLYPSCFDRINNIPSFNYKTMAFQRPNKFQRAGTSDIIGCVLGRFIAIEVKTEPEYNWVMKFKERVGDIYSYHPKNKKEERAINQLIYQDQKARCGGICFFTYSLEHTLKILKAAICEC